MLLVAGVVSASPSVLPPFWGPHFGVHFGETDGLPVRFSCLGSDYRGCLVGFVTLPLVSLLRSSTPSVF